MLFHSFLLEKYKRGVEVHYVDAGSSAVRQVTLRRIRNFITAIRNLMALWGRRREGIVPALLPEALAVVAKAAHGGCAVVAPVMYSNRTRGP